MADETWRDQARVLGEVLAHPENYATPEAWVSAALSCVRAVQRANDLPVLLPVVEHPPADGAQWRTVSANPPAVLASNPAREKVAPLLHSRHAAARGEGKGDGEAQG